MTVAIYLDLEVAALKTMSVQNTTGFLSMGHFVRSHGVEWDPARFQPPPERGPLGQCFRNAALLAISDRSLTYVEGYALGYAIPVLHAWCVTREGEIIETTWRGIGESYVGIPFKTGYLRSRLLKYDCYGMIDQWQRRFPILSEPAKLWLHPRWAKQ